MNTEITNVMIPLLEGYVNFPSKFKIFKNKRKEEKMVDDRMNHSNDILIMIRDVELGFRGTYEEWFILQYDENQLPILK